MYLVQRKETKIIMIGNKDSVRAAMNLSHIAIPRKSSLEFLILAFFCKSQDARLGEIFSAALV